VVHLTNDEAAAGRPWVWSQHWLDVLFLHWQVPAEDLRPRVPAPLEVATFAGHAWVSLVLFRLRVRPRGLPFLPGLSGLVEINLRTYVHFRGRPAIWFLSVHADNAWAIRLARLLTPMPYRQAAMRYRQEGGQLHFRAWQADPAFGLALDFRPEGEGTAATAGTLDDWLLERYRLFLPGRRGELLEAEVTHPRWVARGVAVSLAANSLGRPEGLDLARAPDRAHFSAGVRARFGAFRKLEGVEAGVPVAREEPASVPF
jgi:uncharacterized protein YqjF (DUF2071 family)